MYHVNTQGVDECMIKVQYYAVLNINIIPILKPVLNWANVSSRT